MDPLRFALLGLGAGAAYGLVGQGLVLVYRGAGIVNFAQGAMGMCGAYAFFTLRDHHRIEGAAALVVALAVAALGGALVNLLIMRPLRNATPLVRLISTLALMLTLLTAVEHTQDGGVFSVPPVLPTGVVSPLPRTPIGVDRLVLFGIAGAVTLALWLAYRKTWFGLATSAVAENPTAAGVSGVSPDVVASLNWAIASVLAGAAAIFITSLSGEFNPQTLTLLVIPGLAAALTGAFSSFPLALLGAVAIGIAESEMGRYVNASGWAESGPFIVIVIMLALRGRGLPARGDRASRSAALGTGRFPTSWTIGGLVILLTAVWLVSTSWVGAITATALDGVILLSLVVVVGYAGQLSLAQYTLAGLGAWVTARLVASEGLPFEIAAVVGVTAAVLIGLVIGLASLRARGVNLAVATLGAGLLLEQVVLLNPARTGGIAGTHVGNLTIFGLHLDSVGHPQRYATFVILVLGVLMFFVANLRRSASGRRLIAIRGNERAAASLGVNVFGAKLYAFGISAGIAAIGGVLGAFEYPDVVFTQYTVLASITAVMQAVVGGIGYIMGAVLGGTLTPGSVTQLLLDRVVSSSSSTFILALIGAVGALLILMSRPEGLASRAPWPLNQMRRRDPVPTRTNETAGDWQLQAVRQSSLEVKDLSVAYGGVQALNGAALKVVSGEVLGLIGPNGSGKTTLIDAVTGFVSCSGQVILNGHDLTTTGPAKRARLGMTRTFQGLELFPGMTVADNLRVASDGHSIASYARDPLWPRSSLLTEEALAVARALELDDVLDEATDRLSFGRQRLVAIARSLVRRPSVVLLDEPAAGLGTEDTEDLGRLLRRVADEMNVAVLVVEHDISLVTNICDRIVVLERGEVIATGPPAEVLQEEAVVAAYLGGRTTVEASEPTSQIPFAGQVPPAQSFPGDQEPVLRGQSLTAGYGSLAAIRDVDIEVHRGEIVALLGPNGAGKTSTLLALAGVLSPMGGAVLWNGQPFRGPLHQRLKQGLAIVPEERSVLGSLTTEANLRLARGDLATAFDLFPELAGLMKRPAGLLSGGEQQMLSLARALSTHPQVLLVDELSLGLAPVAVDRLFKALRSAAEAGLGIIMVEQYAQRALELADRVYVLNNGECAIHGPAQEFLSDPDRLRRSYLSLSAAKA